MKDVCKQLNLNTDHLLIHKEVTVIQLSSHRRKPTFRQLVATGPPRMDRLVVTQGNLTHTVGVQAHRSAFFGVGKENCASFHLCEEKTNKKTVKVRIFLK